jgi:hypothetical protein
MPESFTALIDRFGIGPFAEVIGVSYGAAKQMRRRSSVAAVYWPPLLEAAKQRGWDDVTAETLTKLAGERRVAKAAASARRAAPTRRMRVRQ